MIRVIRGDGPTVNFLDGLAAQELPACSAVTIYEVEVGMRPEEEIRTRALLARLEVLPLTAMLARRAAAEARAARARGRTLSPADALIAATALVHNLTLVTADKSGFRVPGLRTIVL